MPVNRYFGSNLLRANKVDGVTIEGDLTPLHNNLLIKVKEVAKSTPGGLVLPDNAKERPTEGTVVAAGPGKVHPETAILLEMSVRVGDSVLYGKYDGTELKYNDANHQLIKDDDVLLIYKEPLTLETVQCAKDNVLVRLPPKEEKTATGIFVAAADSGAKRGDWGHVVCVGPGKQAAGGQRLPVPLKPGDGVRFRDYAGNQVKIEGKDYVVVKAVDILAKW
eukprot:gene40735-49680_t